MLRRRPKQGLTNAKVLTIELPEGRESPYHRSDYTNPFMPTVAGIAKARSTSVDRPRYRTPGINGIINLT